MIFPPFEYKVRLFQGQRQLFDIIRNRYVVLTPEEWVRQHFVNMLIEYKGYPATLTANEVSITLNGMMRRCDTVVYDKNLRPIAIVEYKAPTVKIDEKVFAQIARYNLVLKVNFLIVSNGLQHFCCKMDYEKNSYSFLREIPAYDVVAAQ